jgi:hypothetical protein
MPGAHPESTRRTAHSVMLDHLEQDGNTGTAVATASARLAWGYRPSMLYS